MLHVVCCCWAERIVWNWVLEVVRAISVVCWTLAVVYSLHWLTVAVVERTISPGATVVLVSAQCWAACWTCRTGLTGGWM